LRQVLKQTGAKAVLTSTWRCDPIGLLAARYWKILYFSVCPDRPKSARHREIRSWLAAHPNVSRYALLDDEDDDLRYLNGETDEDMRLGLIKRAGQNIRALFERSKS
jgi:hypothetical protein